MVALRPLSDLPERERNHTCAKPSDAT